jgi:dephospho-CoA kinase
LLGGIGAGKSYVARRAAALGPGTVVDADALAHEALERCAADGRLAQAVGPEFVRDGKPEVEVLGRRAFEEPVLLRRLERLIHPYCHAAIKAAITDHREGEGPPLLVLDVPLLIEVGLDRSCDSLWFVDVPDALRAERAGHRGLGVEQVQRRETFQSPLERKRARADRIIHNDVDDAELDRQILEGLRALGLPRPHREPAPTSGKKVP